MDLSALSSKDAKKKYVCSKEIIRLAHNEPKKLIKDYEFFLELLKSENNIMKWTAIDAIGGIVSVTGLKRGVKLLISYLNKGKMITAGHAMDALTQIAIAKPEFKKQIIKELIKVPNYKYDTDECNRIACSRIIACLEILEAKGKIIESFLKEQSKSKRNATKNRAQKLLKKII
ncbi:MAG: hypothetical protein PHN56_00740 [Candidatus Nanoarchaeia archaeon]|nr:hypothetical protein [Candidatus Nanoarchaeia archaeon]